MWEQDLFCDHLSLATLRTDSGIDAGETTEEILPGGFLILRLFTPGVQDLTRLRQLCLPVAIAQDPIVSDLDEPLRQNV